MHDQTCDNCHQPRRSLYTHVVPMTIRPDAFREAGRTITCLMLCQACGAQRRQDLRDFLSGEPPTALVCPGGSQ